MPPKRTALNDSASLPGSGRWIEVAPALAIYLSSRLVASWMVLQAARREFGPHAGWDEFLSVSTNWDGRWFRGIVEHGYPTTLPTRAGGVTENAWGFMAGYPVVVSGVMKLSHAPFEIAAPGTSMVLGACAFVVIHRILRSRCTALTTYATLAVLAFWPASIAFQLAYSDSLALLLISVWLLCLEHDKLGAAALLILLLGVTRPVAIPAAAVTLVHLWTQRRTHQQSRFPVSVIALAMACCAACLLWPLVAAIATRDPLGYFKTMEAWQQGTGLPTGMIFHLSATKGPWAAIVVLTGLCLVGIVLVRARDVGWSRDLRLWSFVYLTYLALAGQATTGVLRYSLLAIVPLWPLPQKNPPPSSDKTAVEALVVLPMAVLGCVVAQYLWATHILVAAGTPGSAGLP